jgi:hypothetical protein
MNLFQRNSDNLFIFFQNYIYDSVQFLHILITYFSNSIFYLHDMFKPLSVIELTFLINSCIGLSHISLLFIL